MPKADSDFAYVAIFEEFAMQAVNIAEIAPVIGAEKHAAPVVLCVDDDALTLKLLKEFLGHAGFHVICETDSGRAMRRIHTVEFDAAVVDVHMKGWNGSELAEIIHGEKPGIPIFMFSGAWPPPETRIAVTKFISKDSGIDSLIAELRRTLFLQLSPARGRNEASFGDNNAAFDFAE